MKRLHSYSIMILMLFTIGVIFTHHPCQAADNRFISTFFGGSGDDWGFCIARDPAGNIFISGPTKSAGLPAFMFTYDGSWAGGSTEITGGDIYIAKFDPTLSSLLAFTYLGGSGDEQGQWMEIDENGDVYIAGFTNSMDFPTTAGALDRSRSGVLDAFISRLDNDLSTLIASTLVGGSSHDRIYAIRLGEDGVLYCFGGTGSSDFPVTPGAYDQTYSGGSWNDDGGDLFVLAIDRGLSAISISTFLGGADIEFARNMLISGGEIYLTGVTRSEDYPTTTGAYDTSYNGGENVYGGDAFITRMDMGLSMVISSTYFGGSYDDWGYSMDVNDAGDIYLTGHLVSPDMPVTQGAYDVSWNGGEEAYVAMFSADLSELLACTFLGSNDNDFGGTLKVLKDGTVVVAGHASGSNFPASVGAFDPTHNGSGDGFIARLNFDLTTMIACTFIGGPGNDMIFGLLLDDEENIYSVGSTTSLLFPVSEGAFDQTYNGHTGFMGDAVLFSIDPMLGVDTSQVATFLSSFGHFWRDHGLALEWKVSEPSETADFRLEAVDGPSVRSLEVEMKTDMEFMALDEAPSSISREGIIVYRLYHLSPDRGWMMIHESEYSPSHVPGSSRLLKTFPNPFNPSVEISCLVSDPGDVSIGIYDIAGRLITDLYSGFREAGEYSFRWDGTDGAGMAIMSGIYFARMRAGKASDTRKIVLMR